MKWDPKVQSPGAALTKDTANWVVQVPRLNGWDAGYCYGYFANPRRVGGVLEWGAQQTCDGTDALPQGIRVRLQHACTAWNCIRFTTKRTQSKLNQYSRVVTIAPSTTCGSSNTYDYRQEVDSYARGGVFLGTFLSDEYRVSCGI